jgi:hypothetical protein
MIVFFHGAGPAIRPLVMLLRHDAGAPEAFRNPTVPAAVRPGRRSYLKVRHDCFL